MWLAFLDGPGATAHPMRMSNARPLDLKKFCVLCLLATLPFSSLRAADTNALTLTGAPPEENATSNEALRAFLQVQEQLHATQLAIERNRQEAQAAAAQDAITLSNHLQAIEQSLVVQRATDLADAQRTNHLLLLFIGLFAMFGFIAALVTSYFQWRAVNRLAEISAMLPALRGLPEVSAATALGMREHQVLGNGSVEQSNSRFLALVGLLEKRIADLEHTTTAPLKESLPVSNGQAQIAVPPAVDAKTGNGDGRIASLLENGQSLLNGERLEEAVACFDEVLALNPNHAEALVKKGSALEKMRQPQEALDCYDRAIHADETMTIAYLHKGGLCNRLERYGEAMECYERALHTQEKKKAA